MYTKKTWKRENFCWFFLYDFFFNRNSNKIGGVLIYYDKGGGHPKEGAVVLLLPVDKSFGECFFLLRHSDRQPFWGEGVTVGIF